MKPHVKIYFTDEQSRYPVKRSLKRLLRRAVSDTLTYEKKDGCFELSVTFTDNDGIRELNRTHRQIDRPTDVLSFPLQDFSESDVPMPKGSALPLGDIVISLEKAQVQSEEYGHSFEREVAFLCVHSMLHLLGYDHVNGEEEEADMRRRQREILTGMGLAVQ